jgi:8-oxo-dGTP pyrophosphatase MutT (NUDIX family)
MSEAGGAMGFEPQKFFIGLVDFFSTWLPGAILAYLLTITPPFGDQLNPTSAEHWAVFLVGSYLLGHFIFVLGSRLDLVYDWLRQGTRDGQIQRLAKGKPLSSWLSRKFGRLVFGKHDRALRQVIRIKEACLGPSGAAGAVNAFQWSKARLAVEKPDGLGLVHRFEADSKFFRSLLVMLLIAIPWLWWAHQDLIGVLLPQAPRILVGALLAIAVAGLLGLSFWRFVDLRSKSTSQAYWLILALEGERAGEPRSVPPRRDGLTHAGGVVVRRDKGGWEFLAVRASKDRNQWVLPKGHIEPGERSPAAAVREVLEETGVWARPARKLDDIAFQTGGRPVKARFYLMNFAGEEPLKPEKVRWLRAMDEPGDAPREMGWMPLNEAGMEQAALPKENLALLQLAREALEEQDQAGSRSTSTTA